jgi:hypothetical protein
VSDDPLDELGRDLWPTLYYVAHRGPRLASTWGHCPTCQLPASRALRFADTVWSLCSPCGVRWRVDETSLANLDPPDRDDERSYLDLCELAECHELDPLPDGIPPPATVGRITIREEKPHVFKKTPPPKSFGIDPQKFQSGRDTRLLSPLPERHRIAITDLIIQDMVEHPPFVRHPITNKRMLRGGADGHCWHRVRDIVIDPATGADFEQIIRDPAVSPLAIRSVMEFLGSLQERRALLEEQLHALDEIAAAFATEEHVAS